MKITKNSDKLYEYIKNDLDGKLVFDIGAAKGAVTKEFISYGAQVVCVEPQKNRIKEDNIAGSIAFVNKGVSDGEKDLVFYRCKNAPNISTVDIEWTKGKHRRNNKWEKMVIHCTTLDKLIEEYGMPFYIKIDVENYEGAVLAGLTSPPNMISFEYTGGFFENFKLCMDRVAVLGFSQIIAFEKHKKRLKDGTKIGYVHMYEFDSVEESIVYHNNLDRLHQGDMLVIL